MIISVRDIPHEGQNFHFTENNTEIKGFIYPMKGGFDLTGEISVKVPMDCSFCANSIQIPVQEKFHEIVMLHSKVRARAKEEVVPQDELEVLYVDGNELDLKPLITQVIDVSLPIQPKCVEKGAPKGYPNCIADWDYEKYSKKSDEMTVSNPFEVLKTLKKN